MYNPRNEIARIKEEYLIVLEQDRKDLKKAKRLISLLRAENELLKSDRSEVFKAISSSIKDAGRTKSEQARMRMFVRRAQQTLNL